jgi:hypothetical protein
MISLCRDGVKSSRLKADKAASVNQRRPPAHFSLCGAYGTPGALATGGRRYLKANLGADGAV